MSAVNADYCSVIPSPSVDNYNIEQDLYSKEFDIHTNIVPTWQVSGHRKYSQIRHFIQSKGHTSYLCSARQQLPAACVESFDSQSTSITVKPSSSRAPRWPHSSTFINLQKNIYKNTHTNFVVFK